MRCAANGWILAAALGVVLGGCREDGEGDESVAMDSGTADGGTADGGTADGGTADGTADDTGTEDSGSGGDDMGPWDSFEERPCPEDSFLTYENFGAPFMLSYCTACHQSMLPADMRQGSPIEVNFDDIDDIRTWADRIWIRAADQNFSMPPVGPPDDEERALLGEWLACGSPTDADLGLLGEDSSRAGCEGHSTYGDLRATSTGSRNPTLNDATCTVCHAQVDPIGG